MKNLLLYRENIFSQNGEDGVLKEILTRLEIKNGSFCEFGAWDGIHLSNTYNLVKENWSGVYIEGDSNKFKSLLETKEKHPNQLTCINKYVSTEGQDSLDSILKTTSLDSDFDVLSIDIDSYDYQVWRSLKHYNPKIVIIEINSGLGGEVLQIHTVDENDNVVLQGSSYASTLNLGKQKGYTCIYHYGNMIFLRNDLFSPDKFEYGNFNWF